MSAVPLGLERLICSWFTTLYGPPCASHQGAPGEGGLGGGGGLGGVGGLGGAGGVGGVGGEGGDGEGFLQWQM